MNTGASIVRDRRLLCVDSQVAHWRKKHDDAMWNGEPRDKVQHYWRCFKEFRRLQQEGVKYVPRF